MSAVRYHRRNGRWAKVGRVPSGPVTLPARYYVARGYKGEVVAIDSLPCNLRKQADAIAREWVALVCKCIGS